MVVTGVRFRRLAVRTVIVLAVLALGVWAWHQVDRLHAASGAYRLEPMEAGSSVEIAGTDSTLVCPEGWRCDARWYIPRPTWLWPEYASTRSWRQTISLIECDSTTSGFQGVTLIVFRDREPWLERLRDSPGDPVDAGSGLRGLLADPQAWYWSTKDTTILGVVSEESSSCYVEITLAYRDEATASAETMKGDLERLLLTGR